MSVKKPLKRIAVTGGGGQIAYSLLFRIASGELFGKDQAIALSLLETPRVIEALKGVVMELEDGAFSVLKEIKVGSDPLEVFEGAHIAILLGAKPRSLGMERKDLIEENGKIFAHQGKALSKVAAKDVLVFVVGNPCNTNCLIAMHNAPNIPESQFFAMTRLDQNRAQFQLAKKAAVLVEDVERLAIWGNHSATQAPDFINATIRGLKATDVITDREWLEKEFVTTVQKRGSEVIRIRGKSSAASAANAILDGIRSIDQQTKVGSWYSMCISSTNNPYGIRGDLIFSFPCQTTDKGEVVVAKGLKWDSFLQEKIAQTEAELIEERDMVVHLLR